MNKPIITRHHDVDVDSGYHHGVAISTPGISQHQRRNFRSSHYRRVAVGESRLGGWRGAICFSLEKKTQTADIRMNLPTVFVAAHIPSSETLLLLFLLLLPLLLFLLLFLLILFPPLPRTSPPPFVFCSFWPAGPKGMMSRRTLRKPCVSVQRPMRANTRCALTLVTH